jgi:UPF0755 protein
MKFDLPKIRKEINDSKLEVVLAIVFVISFYWIYATSSPFAFERDTLIDIKKGQSLKEISQMLKDENIINSQTVFNSLAILTGRDSRLVSGEYIINDKITLFGLLQRLSTGDYGISLRSTTLKEGMTIEEMANFLGQQYKNFDKELFIEETLEMEGYLFPDTYLFPENVDTETIIKTLTKTFQEKIEKVEDVIKDSEFSLGEIIIMASIIEKEATSEARQEVSNILWKRIGINMALQVDATFVYERGLGTFDLTTADLLKDSEYNTYTRTGLPPTPISNPGLESIIAATQPQKTNNLFFLTGADGEMYYAETFAIHKQNKARYLR